MKEKIKPIGYYNYTVYLTYVGMLIGFTGIMLTTKHEYKWALICLMIAGVCDLFDGTVASTKKDRTRDERTFGIQIDSLSDLICFGVLPAALIFEMAPRLDFTFIAPCVFILCGLIRLAYFNVDEANRQATTNERRSYYLGLPITTSALVVPAVFEVCAYLNKQDCLYYVGVISLLITGICYITPFHLKKPKLLGEILIVLFGAVEFSILIAGVNF